VDVSFKESVFGCLKDVTIEHDLACLTCSSTGAKSRDAGDIMCSSCHGNGYIKIRRDIITTTNTCNDCGGSGRRVRDPCEVCEGRGKLIGLHVEKVTVPPGVEPGSKEVLSVRPDGDDDAEEIELHVEYQIEEHPYFKRKRSDVHIEVPITYTQAVLGDTVQVPSIYGGSIDVAILPGTQPTEEKRLPQQGFFNISGEGQGDMVVHFIIEIPRFVSQEQRKALQQLSTLEQEHLSSNKRKFLQFMCDWDTETKL